MRARGSIALAVAGAFLAAGLCQAGNKEMVEQRVQELDDLNRQVVGQIKELPSDGQVDLKAHVIVQDGTPSVEILEKRVVETKGAKDAPIEFKKGNVTPSSAGEATSKESPDEQRPK